MPDCTHDLAEKETAVGWDGLCPICLMRERDEAVALAEERRLQLQVCRSDVAQGLAGIEEFRAVLDEVVAALSEAYDLFAVEETIEPEHLRDDDDFDRWCISTKALLARLFHPKEPTAPKREPNDARNGSAEDRS